MIVRHRRKRERGTMSPSSRVIPSPCTPWSIRRGLSGVVVADGSGKVSGCSLICAFFFASAVFLLPCCFIRLAFFGMLPSIDILAVFLRVFLAPILHVFALRTYDVFSRGRVLQSLSSFLLSKSLGELLKNRMKGRQVPSFGCHMCGL
jgi:hypothetical protein